MVECKLCGIKMLMLNSHIERTHNIRISEYRLQFGDDTPLRAKSVTEKKSKNASSPYMVTHWVKKGYSDDEAQILVREYLDKHASHAREYSPRCAEYWVKNGYTDDDAKVAISDFQRRDLDYYTQRLGSEEGKIKWDNIREAIKYSCSRAGLKEKGMSDEEIREYKDHRSLGYYIGVHGEELGKKLYDEMCLQHRAFSPRCVEYWIKNGYTNEEAKIKVSNFQIRNLYTFIDKYGADDGVMKYRTWIKTTRKGGNSVSKESVIFFKSLVEFCETNNIQYKKEFRIDRDNGRGYYYDLALPSLKLIFEYDGSFFHADPTVIDENWRGGNGLTYFESLEADCMKETHAIKHGYDVKRIHSKYKQNFNIIDIVLERIKNG